MSSRSVVDANSYTLPRVSFMSSVAAPVVLSAHEPPSRSTSLPLRRNTKLVCACFILASASLSPAEHTTLIYSLSASSFSSVMFMRFSEMYFFPFSTSSFLQSRSTSSCSSGFPASAPRAIAMGRPIIPVPGMPTPIAFLKMFALSLTSMCSGCEPSISAAFATQRATAIGSVQPIAGTT